jgi:hypothetical protein
MLHAFARRRDLRRHAEALADSGIAGTPITYLFFAETAAWLVRRWPDAVTIDWDELEDEERLEQALPLFACWSETPGLDECGFAAREWVARMKGRDETDAAFVVRRCRAIRPDPFAYERFYEDLGLTLRLAPRATTPARTHARVAPARVAFQRGPLSRGRPLLREAVRLRPRRVRPLSRADGARYVDMAREAMVTRSRDLDAFAYGSPDDVRLVDWEDGLQFAAIGMIPERRLLLEAVYAFLTLKNGVPIGYVLNSALFGSAEVAYNVFETYRGAEAAHVYARALATVRELFGTDSFTIYPYQLGEDNEEAVQSGAWWFYQKLGFAPRDRAARALMQQELARMRRRPAHRSSPRTLRRLAGANVFWHAGARRDDVIGLLPLANAGLAVTAYLARRFGSDRERGEETCAREAARLLGVGSLRGWSAAERLAWRRWSPLVGCLPGADRWPTAAKRALATVVRAKGGRRESDFVRGFDAHALLRRAIALLAIPNPRTRSGPAAPRLPRSGRAASRQKAWP